MRVSYYEFYHTLLIFAANPPGYCTDDNECTPPKTCQSDTCGTHIDGIFRSS